MEQHPEQRPDWYETGRLIPAVVLIGIGALYFLNNMHVFPDREVLRYWPGIMIAVGVLLLVDSREQSGRSVGGALTAVGAFLLARNLFFVDLRWNQLWPLVLIAMGLLMLWDRTHWYMGKIQEGYTRRPRHIFGFRTTMPKESTVFGASTRNYAGQEFAGGRYETFLGGVEIDLRGSHMAGDEAVLRIEAVLGGAEIKVPDTWLVIIRATAVFGAVVNSTKAPDPMLVPNPKRLIVRGSAVFGGVEIKN